MRRFMHQQCKCRTACNRCGFEHLILPQDFPALPVELCAHLTLPSSIDNAWNHPKQRCMARYMYVASAGVSAGVGFSHSNEAHMYPPHRCAQALHITTIQFELQHTFTTIHFETVATHFTTQIEWHTCIQCMMMHDIDVI